MHKVLIPYDGSEPSRRALQFVLDQPLAARPAEVHLLNVRERSANYEECLTNSPVDALNEEQITQGRKILDPAAELVAAARLSCQTHVVLGNVEHVVADEAARLGCDQIVMGASGLGTLKSLFVGSTAAKVVHLANIPVTLIK